MIRPGPFLFRRTARALRPVPPLLTTAGRRAAGAGRRSPGLAAMNDADRKVRVADIHVDDLPVDTWQRVDRLHLSAVM